MQDDEGNPLYPEPGYQPKRSNRSKATQSKCEEEEEESKLWYEEDAWEAMPHELPPLLGSDEKAVRHPERVKWVLPHGNLINVPRRCRETLPESARPRDFSRSQLMLAGYRGGSYQLFVLIAQLSKIMADNKKTGDPVYFEATFEIQNYGNLDDIRLTLKDKDGTVTAVHGYQVKYYNHPIPVFKFFNKDAKSTQRAKGKTAKMHIGKFFDGWLEGRAAHPDLALNNLTSIVYSNASLDDTLDMCVENGCFKEMFVTQEQPVTIIRNEKITPIVYQNFLENKIIDGVKIPNRFSTRVWRELERKGYLDAAGYLTEMFQPNGTNFILDIDEHRLSKIRAGTVTIWAVKREVMSHLREIYDACKSNHVDLYGLLYEEAWTYLSVRTKDRHKTTIAMPESEKQEKFNRFLYSFRFQVNQPSFQRLEVYIQKQLTAILGKTSEQAFLALCYAIQNWLLHKYEKGRAPILTNEIMKHLLKMSLIRYHDALQLQGRSQDVLAHRSYCCIGGRTVPRPELSIKLTAALTQPGLVMLVGEQGIGKSGLIKQGLLTHYQAEYLILSSADLVADEALYTQLLKVLNNVITIRIVVLDGAESLLLLPEERLCNFLNLLKEQNRTVVLTITPAASHHPYFQHERNVIHVKRLALNRVIRYFPELSIYIDYKPLMKKACIPYYLSAITALINQMDEKEFDYVAKAHSNVLEIKLVKLLIAGQGADKSARKLAWQKIAVNIARAADENSLTIHPGLVKIAASLCDEGILENVEGQYRFSHDLSFKYGLMLFWLKEWRRSVVLGKTTSFWSKFDRYLQAGGTKKVFEKWYLTYQSELVDDIVACAETISTMSYFKSFIALAIITRNGRLLTKFLNADNVPLNENFDQIFNHSSATYILLAILYDYPTGLTLLIANGEKLHHPHVGRLIIEGDFARHGPMRRHSASLVETMSSKPEQYGETDSSSLQSISSSTSTSDSASSETDEDGWEYVLGSDGNWGYSGEVSDESDNNWGMRSDKSDDSWSSGPESEKEDKADIMSDFTKNPNKYGIAGFDEELGHGDEEGRWIPGQRHTVHPDYCKLYIYQAVIYDRANCLAILLNAYNDNDQAQMKQLHNRYNETPLHLGALNKAHRSVQLLLERGVTIDSSDDWGETPLHNAAYVGDVTLAKTLLTRSADPNTTNKNGLSPLHIAITRLDLAMVEACLEYGGNILLKPFEPFIDNQSVADLLEAVGKQKRWKEKEDAVETFVISLIRLLNYGCLDDAQTKTGEETENQFGLCFTKLRPLVEDLMDFTSNAQLSDFKPKFDYIDEASELDYVVTKGCFGKLDYLIKHILSDPDNIAKVLQCPKFASGKTTLLELWFEDIYRLQLNNLEAYAKEYDDKEVQERVAEYAEYLSDESFDDAVCDTSVLAKVDHTLKHAKDKSAHTAFFAAPAMTDHNRMISLQSALEEVQAQHRSCGFRYECEGKKVTLTVEFAEQDTVAMDGLLTIVRRLFRNSPLVSCVELMTNNANPSTQVIKLTCPSIKAASFVNTLIAAALGEGSSAQLGCE